MGLYGCLGFYLEGLGVKGFWCLGAERVEGGIDSEIFRGCGGCMRAMFWELLLGHLLGSAFKLLRFQALSLKP